MVDGSYNVPCHGWIRWWSCGRWPPSAATHTVLATACRRSLAAGRQTTTAGRHVASMSVRPPCDSPRQHAGRTTCTRSGRTTPCTELPSCENPATRNRKTVEHTQAAKIISASQVHYGISVSDSEKSLRHSKNIVHIVHQVSQWRSGRVSDFWPSNSQSVHYQAPRSTQPSIPPGSVNQVPAFTGWG